MSYVSNKVAQSGIKIKKGFSSGVAPDVLRHEPGTVGWTRNIDNDETVSASGANQMGLALGDEYTPLGSDGAFGMAKVNVLRTLDWQHDLIPIMDQVHLAGLIMANREGRMREHFNSSPLK